MTETDGNSCELERDILKGRSFSLADVIGKEAGSFMKGDSPVPKLVQATTEILLYIEYNLTDSSGALKAALKTWVQTHEVDVSCHLNSPLNALSKLLEQIVANPELLYEFVRRVDVQWGETYGERPFFQKPGQAPHPDDEYTHESVHQALSGLLASLKASLEA
ncbi:MAG TPA: hypothetical protein IGS53_25795 [Leptolyngbyaceae cyanobacterium M33_DOE_097]|uniref:Uncharacterized protein n=1 Tax=Oscillatoriales cyanobacterium SpSt-418 TaxID=2282169 RepID=A0A7C3PDI9_9CYAN|nr:hypothetical protein [Leptolyngbyaceae cyanobacterium M33_DOE_097]